MIARTSRGTRAHSINKNMHKLKRIANISHFTSSLSLANTAGSNQRLVTRLQPNKKEPKQMQHRTFEDQLHEDLRSWKKANPDWRTYATDEQAYDDLAAFGILSLQRKLNAHGLRPNPSRGHIQTYMESEALTLVQEANGLRLPLHESMERGLAKIITIIDSHLLGHVAANTTKRVEYWFDMNIRQPAASALRHARR
jgi:hypothetical protein